MDFIHADNTRFKDGKGTVNKGILEADLLQPGILANTNYLPQTCL